VAAVPNVLWRPFVVVDGLHTRESKAVAASVRKLMREARDLIKMLGDGAQK